LSDCKIYQDKIFFGFKDGLLQINDFASGKKIFECSFESSEIRFLDFFVTNELTYISNEGIY